MQSDVIIHVTLSHLKSKELFISGKALLSMLQLLHIPHVCMHAHISECSIRKFTDGVSICISLKVHDYTVHAYTHIIHCIVRHQLQAV